MSQHYAKRRQGQRLELLESILAASTQYSIVGLAVDGTIEAWNEGARLNYGYAPDAVIGKATMAILHTPEDQAAGTAGLMQHVALRQGHWTGEVERVRQDGERFMATVSLTVRRDGAGEHIGYLLISRDISDERKFRGLLESAPDAMVVVNRDRRIVLVNARAEKVFGYAREELLGNSVDMLVPEAGNGSCGRRRDGGSFPVEVSQGPLETDQGVLVSMAIRDVSERRRTEERFRRLVEAAPDAMVIVNRAGKIVIVNSQTERLFGYKRGEMIGESMEMLVPERFGGIHPDHRNGYSSSPRVRPMGAGLELYGRRKGGGEFPVEISLSPLDTEQDEPLVASSIRDITDRKRVEQALKEKNAELERANHAKDTFLASMSHELRTPLNTVIGYAGTLLMRLPGPLTEEQEKQVRTIQRNGRHLLSLINDVLDLAKIESGKVELHPEPLDLCELLRDVMYAERLQAVSKGVSLTLEVPDYPVAVRTDQRSVHQIVLNLVNNAVKFTDKGSVRIQLTETESGGASEVAIRVIDTGVGIRTADYKELFQMFRQLDGPSGRKSKGTGLGLHLSRRLAELLGGQLTFESEPGVGSTFQLLLRRE